MFYTLALRKGLYVRVGIEKRQPGNKGQLKNQKDNLMQTADRTKSAETNADSEQKDEVTSSTQHGIKPNVVGSQVLPRTESYTKSDLSTQKKVDKVLSELYGLNLVEAKRILRISSNCLFAFSEKAELEVFV